MSSETEESGVVGRPVAQALAEVHARLLSLVGVLEAGGLAELDNRDLIKFMQDFEGFRNQLASLYRQLILKGQSRQ